MLLHLPITPVGEVIEMGKYTALLNRIRRRRYKILLADNNPDFLATRKEFLDKEGSQVVVAMDPTETRRILGESNIDLAILDIRLEEDDDRQDASGLIIAKEFAPLIPKIILTGYPDWQTARELLREGPSGERAALDYVAKKEGKEVLISRVYQAFKATSKKDARELEYLRAQKQRDVTYYLGITLKALGKLIIIAGAVLVLTGKTSEGAYTVIGGIAMDGAGISLWRYLDNANKRVKELRPKSDNQKNDSDEKEEE